MSDAFDPSAQPAGPGSPHGLSTQGAVPAADYPQPQPPPQQPSSSDGPLPDDGGPPPADSGNRPAGDAESPWRSLPINREPYIRRFGRRHHSEWGQPDYIIEGARRYPGVAPGPWMPQADEINKLVYQVGSQLMMQGSNPVAQIAGQMTNARGLYAQATLKGQKAQSDYQYEVYDQNRRILIDKQTDELKKASGIFAVYGKDKDELKDQLTQMANEFNDPELLRVLNSKGVEAAVDLLHTRDNLNKDMMATQAQADKHAEQVADEELKRAKAQHEKSLAGAYQSWGYSGYDDPRLGGAAREDTSDAGTGKTKTGGGETPAQVSEDEDWNKERDTPRDLSKMPGDEGGGEDSTGAWTPPEAKDAAGNPAPKADLSAPSLDASGAAPMALPGQDDNFPAVGGQDIPTRGAATPIDESPPAASAGAAAPAQTAQMEPLPGASASWMQSPPPPPASVKAGDLPVPPKIDAAARTVLNGGTLPTGIPQGIKNAISARVYELSGKLDNVLKNAPERQEGIKDDDPREVARQKAIYDAVDGVDHRMAQRLRQLLLGNEAPPSNWSQRGQPWQALLPLGSKIDPTFNKSTFTNRAKIISSFTSGIDGRNVTSVGTAFQHLLQLREALKNRPGYMAQMLGGVRAFDIGKQFASPDEQKAIGNLQSIADTATDEYERAVIGGKPGQSTLLHGRMDVLNTDENVLLGNIDSKIEALQKRLGELQRRFNTGTGQPDKKMREVFDHYVSQLSDNPLNDDDKKAPQRLDQLTQWKKGQDGGKGSSGGQTYPAPAGLKEGDVRWDKRTGRKYEMRGGQMVPVQ